MPLGFSAVLDSVARQLAGDETFLAFKGLDVGSSNEDKAAYIIKDEETDGNVDSTIIPICLIYDRPGRPDARTSQIYVGKVVIDCFAGDGNTARMMCDRTFDLLHRWQPDGTGGVCVFAFGTSFKTGITGVKGHRIFYDISQIVG